VVVHTRRQTPLSCGGFIQRTLYVKGTDGIVVISNGLKKTFIQKGFPENHLTVIHNGTPATRYRRPSPERIAKLRSTWGIDPSQPVIGSISRYKKQDQIVRALPALPPDLTVLFAGCDRNDLDDVIRQTAPTQTIICTGTIPLDEILDYYSLLDVNILASTTDGFGLVLLEAMAYDVPVVATAAQGITDVVQHEYNGLLFEDGDINALAQSVTRLLPDTPLRSRCVENGQKTVFSTFSLARTAKRYDEYFASLLAKRRGSGGDAGRRQNVDTRT